MKIGFIGLGVVGGALYQLYKEKNHGNHALFCYDKFKKEYNDFVSILSTDLIFVSVPTPTDSFSKDQDLTAVESVLNALSMSGYNGVIVLKSTVLPGTTKRLSETFGLRLVHNPEFLTEKNAANDLRNEKVVLLSGAIENTIVANAALDIILDSPSVHFFSEFASTEMIKYFHNNYLATTVAFCNEISEACQVMGLNYDSIRTAAIAVGKVPESHTKVPGPDGLYGFGGMCFPKDIQAFDDWLKHKQLKRAVHSGVIDSNNYYRRVYNKKETEK